MSLRHVGLLGVAALLGFGVAVSFPAQAEPISAAFDGHYQGSGQLLSYFSQGKCAKAPSELDVHVVKGEIRGHAEGGVRINGFVTKKGFFTGTYHFGNGAKTTIQGVAGEGKMTGGFLQGETCAYVVNLVKK